MDKIVAILIVLSGFFGIYFLGFSNGENVKEKQYLKSSLNGQNIQNKIDYNVKLLFPLINDQFPLIDSLCQK